MRKFLLFFGLCTIVSLLLLPVKSEGLTTQITFTGDIMASNFPYQSSSNSIAVNDLFEATVTFDTDNVLDYSTGYSERFYIDKIELNIWNDNTGIEKYSGTYTTDAYNGSDYIALVNQGSTDYIEVITRYSSSGDYFDPGIAVGTPSGSDITYYINQLYTWARISDSFDYGDYSYFEGNDIYPSTYGQFRLIATGPSAIGDVDYVASANPVPEPATMLLLGTGLVGLAGFKRKLRKK